jgi:succinate dehydrogenase / fumarate reductase cytochrome b subunit
VTDAKSTPAIGSHFLLRRLHSLCGLVPVGLFLCFHLFTNFQILVGDIQHEVEFIHDMPALFYIEVALWLSIGFHAALGLYYTFVGAKPNAGAYPYESNWRYTLQRITGIIALIFIFVHVAHFRWGWTFGPFKGFLVFGPGGEPMVAESVAGTLQNVTATAFYAIGALSAVYHFANGLWTMAITWGVVVSVGAQKRWGLACAGLGAFLAIFTIGTIVGAWMVDLDDNEKQWIDNYKEIKAQQHEEHSAQTPPNYTLEVK